MEYWNMEYFVLRRRTNWNILNRENRVARFSGMMYMQIQGPKCNALADTLHHLKGRKNSGLQLFVHFPNLACKKTKF